ncbi:MAG: 2Fe-2S iron-sulfur cluster binding domain-containing protein [Aquabacterium sp.]
MPFPHNCRVGGCGECKCRLVSGKVRELTDKSYLLSAEELQQGFILACQSQPRSELVVEVALQPAAPVHAVVRAQGRIEAMQPLTADILHVRLVLDQPMPYSAGQYAAFTVPADVAGAEPGTTRSYSFASAPDADRPDRVDFFIRKVPGGLFTEWLFAHAKVGTTLALSGPHGQFGLRPGDEPMLCIAGGSGLAPIKAMLEQAIVERRASRPLTILLGARTQADLYGLDAIDQIRREWGGRFRFEPVLSAEPAGSDWQGLRGMVNDHLPHLLGHQLAEHSAWMCGPPPMIDACTAVLRQAGVPAERIHHDKFLDASDAARAGRRNERACLNGQARRAAMINCGNPR